MFVGLQGCLRLARVSKIAHPFCSRVPYQTMALGYFSSGAVRVWRILPAVHRVGGSFGGNFVEGVM